MADTDQCRKCKKHFKKDSDDGESISIYGSCLNCRGIIPEVVDTAVVQPVKFIKDILW